MELFTTLNLNNMQKEKFRVLFGGIIVRDTCEETETEFNFRLPVTHSMKFKGDIINGPVVAVTKANLKEFERLAKDQEPEVYHELEQTLFHEHCRPIGR